MSKHHEWFKRIGRFDIYWTETYHGMELLVYRRKLWGSGVGRWSLYCKPIKEDDQGAD